LPRGLALEARDDLAETLNEVDYMTRLVRDLLLMARDESDHRSIGWRPVDLATLIRDVVETARPSTQQHSLALENITTSDEPIWVMGDHDRLRQLLLILLDNATRYTPAGGRVWVEARSGRGPLLGGRRLLAQVIVGDTGVGIAPDQQERIFEAFYRSRGHSASVDQAGGDHGGAGLGLALARWLVTAHDGDISVRSAPEAGSVFTVSLPLLADYRADTDDDAVTEEDQATALADSAPTSDL
jgi:signal transduction histidine kinase